MLRPELLARHVRTERWPAGPATTRWVENYWALRWSLPDNVSYSSQTLPHPACSLTVERGEHARPEVAATGTQVVVTGVVTSRFEVDIRGRGWVFGVKFRPGGLVALTGVGPARAWADRTLPAAGIVPDEVVTALAGLDADGDPDEWVATTEAALGGIPHPVDDRYGALLAIISDILADRQLVSVAQVEQRHHVTGRTLQRWFMHYVGVGPKWVLARYRMHDVVTAIDGGYAGPLTELAHRYGWYDQSHFTRDFTTLVGIPPSRYRDERAGRTHAQR